MSSSSPIDSAWALLKQEDNPADYDLTQLMSEEDKTAATKYMGSLSPEKRKIINQIQENFANLPSDVKGQLTGLSHNLLQQHEGRLSEMLPQSPHADNQVEKMIPALIVATVLAIDAINTSQGAKASLVGNVFADAGNTIARATGIDGNPFGETNYSDVIDRDDQASIVNPITGREHMVNDDPGFFERIGKGTLSAGLSLVNPFAVLGAGAKGTGVVAGKASQKLGQGAGRTVSGAGQKISQSRFAQRGTDKARQKAVNEMGDMGASFGARSAEREAREQAVGRLDRFGRATQSRGKQITDSANANQAQNVAGFKQAIGPDSAFLMGGRAATPYRMGQMFARTPLGQGLNPALPLAALGTIGMNQMSQAPSTGFASQMGSVGATPSQQTPVSGNADPYGMRQIWKPQDNAFEQQSEFGGLGVNKGDNMFKNNIGEELLKEASDRMYKASCAQCNKKDCLGKMHCSMNKAECPKCGKNCKCDDKKKADDKKKPAHGMVIVIGSKAGPGPSTDGKRDKVDSEKDKKEE